MEKPVKKPVNPNFSSGPCAKRPGWSFDALKGAMLGRSHRAAPLKAKLKEVIDLHKEILNIPEGYKVGIVPGSDTGAFEMALWSMLGSRGVDVFAWEAFSGDWLKDVTGQLKLSDVRKFESQYGDIPDLSQADSSRDIVFVWNGTTSGVRVPDGNWISNEREGLTFCDATSAVFAYELPWEKLDVTTWSWQKVLGGEAAHGMIVLSPKAVKRLESFIPDRPLPKIFRMTAKGKLNEALFEGATINTPSMMAVEDCLDALSWVKRIGGLQATIKNTRENYKILEAWASNTSWIEFLSIAPEVRSMTSVCFKIVDPWFSSLNDSDKEQFIKSMTKLLEKEGAGYDIAGYRDAPAGLRIWCGATIEASDLSALTPWLEWSFETAKAEGVKKAA